MKSVLKMLMVIGALALSGLAHAKECKMPADNSSADFKLIKSLAGKWTTTTSMFGKKNQKMFVEYKVTAGGSTVLETIFPGTPYEMISTYYDDNGKLVMTHYCMMRTRTTLKAKNGKDGLTFRVAHIEGAKVDKEHTMGDLTLSLKDKNHFVSSCGGAGKKAKRTSMEFTRVK